MGLVYAAAFFLLAGELKDAITVLSTQVGDDQFAVAVARVYEGDDGPVLKEFIEDKLLPQAVREGNRWLATWAFWMLSKRDKAVRALIVSPLHPKCKSCRHKRFLSVAIVNHPYSFRSELKLISSRISLRYILLSVRPLHQNCNRSLSSQKIPLSSSSTNSSARNHCRLYAELPWSLPERSGSSSCIPRACTTAWGAICLH